MSPATSRPPPHACSSSCSTAITSARLAPGRSRPRPAVRRELCRPGRIRQGVLAGALPAATQDFTTDKARLLAAIDRHRYEDDVGGRRNWIAKSRRLRDARRDPMHAAMIPATARHRSSAGADQHARGAGQRPGADPGRRKTLLLFSEDSTTTRPTCWARCSGTPATSCAGWAGRPGADADDVALYAVDPGRSTRGSGPAGNAVMDLPYARILRPHGCGPSRTIRSRHSARCRSPSAASPRSTGTTSPAPSSASSTTAARTTLSAIPGARRKAGRVSIDRGQGVAARRAHQRAQRLFGQGRGAGAADAQRSSGRNRRPEVSCCRRPALVARRSRLPCRRQRRRGSAAFRLRSRTCSRALCHSQGRRFESRPWRCGKTAEIPTSPCRRPARPLPPVRRTGRPLQRTARAALLTANDAGRASNGSSINIDFSFNARRTPAKLRQH